MIGLNFEQLCLTYDSSFSESVALMREDEKKLEEILGVHADEFPLVKDHFDRMSKPVFPISICRELTSYLFGLNANDVQSAYGWKA